MNLLRTISHYWWMLVSPGYRAYYRYLADRDQSRKGGHRGQ